MKRGEAFKITAGPCLAESMVLLDETAAELKRVMNNFKFDFYFKASYRKANGSSINSHEGAGDKRALDWLGQKKEKYGLKN